jgi:TonB family protein
MPEQSLPKLVPFSLRVSACVVALTIAAPVALENASASPFIPSSRDGGLSERADAIQLMMIRDSYHRVQEMQGNAVSVAPLSMSGIEDISTRDIRGRTLQDDLRDFVESEIKRKADTTLALETALAFNDASEAQLQFNSLISIDETRRAHELAISSYWQSLHSLQREQNLWNRALTKNRLPADLVHGDVVARSELQFRRAVTQDTPLKDTWRAAYREWISALIADRNNVVKKIGTSRQRMQEIEYFSRSTPCPSVSANNRSSVISTHQPGSLRGDAPARMTGPVPDVNSYYPDESRREGVEGIVVLAMKINEHGCPVSAGVSGSSGSDELDAAAMKFVETLKYDPAISNGEYVASTQPIAINFKIARQSERKE